MIPGVNGAFEVYLGDLGQELKRKHGPFFDEGEIVGIGKQGHWVAPFSRFVQDNAAVLRPVAYHSPNVIFIDRTGLILNRSERPPLLVHEVGQAFPTVLILSIQGERPKGTLVVTSPLRAWFWRCACFPGHEFAARQQPGSFVSRPQKTIRATLRTKGWNADEDALGFTISDAVLCPPRDVSSVILVKDRGHLSEHHATEP